MGVLVPGRVFPLLAFIAVSASIVICMNRAKKGEPPKLRRIPAFEAVDEAIGRAVEMGRPIHFTPGKYEITIEMMAGLQALKYAASTVARLDAKMIVTTGRGDTYTVADAIVAEAYSSAGKPQVYQPEMVRYLSDNQFAFASAVMGIISREKCVTNIMVGQFAAESLLMSECGYASGAIQIAGTAQVYQLPFFVATCDYVAIGEELFAADAYFSKDPVSLGCLRGQDIAKALSLGLLIIGVVAKVAGSNVILDLMAK